MMNESHTSELDCGFHCIISKVWCGDNLHVSPELSAKVWLVGLQQIEDESTHLVSCHSQTEL